MASFVPDTKYRKQIERLLNRIFRRHDLQPPAFPRWSVWMLAIWGTGSALAYLLIVPETLSSNMRVKLALIHSWTSFLSQPTSAADTKDVTALIVLLLYMLPVALQFLNASYAAARKGRFAHEAIKLATGQGRKHPADILLRRAVTDGIPLGEYNGKRFGIKRGADAGHVLVTAPTRAGKGLHLTATLETWNGPAVVVDPKREQFERTAAIRAEQGPVFCLPQHSIDILEYFKAYDPLDLQELFNALLQTWMDKSGNPVFVQKAFTLFEVARDVTSATGGHMLRLLAAWSTMDMTSALTEAANYSPNRVSVFIDGVPMERMTENRFATSSWGTFTAKIRAIAPHMETISTGDIPPSWAQDNATIYICYPLDQLEAAGGLLSVVLTALMKGQQRQAKKQHTLFAIDELPTAAIQALDTKLATVGGYGITILAYIQQLSQLRNRYGPDAAASILGNFHHQIFYPTRDNDSAEYVSRKFGSELKVSQAQSGQGTQTSYTQNTGSALESSQINTLPETGTIVFTDDNVTIAQRINPFTDRKEPLPAPPVIEVKRGRTTRLYDEHGQLIALRQPLPATSTTIRLPAAAIPPIQEQSVDEQALEEDAGDISDQAEPEPPSQSSENDPNDPYDGLYF